MSKPLIRHHQIRIPLVQLWLLEVHVCSLIGHKHNPIMFYVGIPKNI